MVLRRSLIAAVVAALVAACVPVAQPSSSPISTRLPEATIRPTPVPSAPATPAPATPGPIALPSLATPIPPDPSAAWTGIAWRQLAPDDPLGQVRSIVRWQGGYVATGAIVVTGETSATPFWVSTDGAAWHRLGPDVLGPATIVLGVGATAGGLVALTLQGGEDTCPFQPGDIECVELGLPLQAWTSPDAATWAAHAGPELELVAACEGCGIEPPAFVAGLPGLLVLTGYVEAAISGNGVDWELLPSGTIASGIEPGNVTRFGSGFVGVGERSVRVDGSETVKPIALTSLDGRHWERHSMPFEPGAGGAFADGLVVGPAGLISEGSTRGAPGFGLWWSSLDGVSWTGLSEYPPLGPVTGEGQGSGASPNGTVIGNGDRMLAYRANAPETAWTSFDGTTWLPLALEGDLPDWEGTDTQYPELILTPAGVFAFGRDRAVWFGEPHID